MNLSDFVELSEERLQDDERLKLTELMTSLASAAANYASAPGEPSYQVEFSKALQRLANALITAEQQFHAGTALRLVEIGALRWFSHTLIDEITSNATENAMTPAIISQTVSNLNQLRTEYPSKLKISESNLREFGVKDNIISEGEAVAKFILPSSMFDNELKGLSKELKFITQFIDLINEIVTGNVESMELVTLATTDPEIIIKLGLLTASTVGGVSLWAVNLWSKIEETKKFRADTRNLNAETALNITALLEADIQKEIKDGIDEKVKELVGIKPEGRRAELKTNLVRLLRQFLERVERGMVVTVRAIPFYENEKNEEYKQANVDINSVNTLGQSIVKQINTGDPVLQITYETDIDLS